MHFFISLNLSLQRLTGIENLQAPRRPPRAQESAPTTASALPNDEPAIFVVSDAPPAHPPTPPPQPMSTENIELVFLGRNYTFHFFTFFVLLNYSSYK